MFTMSAIVHTSSRLKLEVEELSYLVSLELSKKFQFSVSELNDCGLEFVSKYNSVSRILVDVARFTKSVNFTLLITVGNLSSAKMQFWLVAKKK